MSVGVIIPAGGSGKRVGLKTEKQFLKINRISILERTLLKFNNHKEINEIVLVLPKSRIKKLAPILIQKYKKISSIVGGGKKRTQSVINGFYAFQKHHNIILIHDCVRPFIEKSIISKTIKECKRYGAVTVAVKVKDTIKIVNKTKILGTPNRETLWHTQTPQGFKYGILKESLDFALKNKIWDTDECQLVEKLGKDVYVVNGSYYNLKITTKEDLLFAKAIIG